MKEGDSKTKNNITVIIIRITDTKVYYMQGCVTKKRNELARVWCGRAEFERLWEAEI